MRALLASKGSSTLEVLLAFAVMTLALTAAASVVFSNQTVSVDIEGSVWGLAEAQSVLEDARARARYDFNLLNPTTSLAVVQVSPYVKRATAQVEWQSFGRRLTTTLVTDISDTWGIEAGESCSSIVGEDWSRATLGSQILVGTSTISGMALRAVGNKLVVTTEGTHAGDQDFYVYDVSATPQFLGSMDANGSAAGINGVAYASTSLGHYVYAASDAKPEILVLDVSLTKPKVLARYTVPTSTPPYVTGGRANTLVYRAGYLYVGLSKTGTGPEFVVLDMSAPTAPAYVGSYDVEAGIADIRVAHDTAYLVTADNTREVMLLDVSDPGATGLISAYRPPGSTSFGSAQSIALVGNTLYLGRSYDNGTGAPEWYSLDMANLSTPKKIASLDIATSTANAQSVGGILVRGTFSFLAARDGVHVWNIATASLPTLVRKIDSAAAGVRIGAIACSGNTVYVGGYRTADDRGVLYTLEP